MMLSLQDFVTFAPLRIIVDGRKRLETLHSQERFVYINTNVNFYIHTFIVFGAYLRILYYYKSGGRIFLPSYKQNVNISFDIRLHTQNTVSSLLRKNFPPQNFIFLVTKASCAALMSREKSI